jgi:hypothetical protein
MKKNIGKRLLLKNFISHLNGNLWCGVDKSIYDDNQILLSTPDQYIRTRSAKEAKINLFNYFLTNNDQNYLFLFEDDIIIHTDFFVHFDSVIQFANTNKFKLIYFGVSCYVPQKNNLSFSIDILPQSTYRYSGAYGVIIHRSVLKSLINRSNDPFLYSKPFDIYSLGHIQSSYPLECFICNPQLISPNITISDIRNPRSQNDFWSLCHIDKSSFIIEKHIDMFIVIDDNKIHFDYYINILSMLIPYIIPTFIHTSNYSWIDNFKNIYTFLYVDDITNVDYHISDDTYIFTNFYVIWNFGIKNIFKYAKNMCNQNIIFTINKCDKYVKNCIIDDKLKYITPTFNIINTHNDSCNIIKNTFLYNTMLK